MHHCTLHDQTGDMTQGLRECTSHSQTHILCTQTENAMLQYARFKGFELLNKSDKKKSLSSESNDW